MPTGLKGEVLPTLKWIRKHLPCSRVVLGLRDILDDAESTRRDWARKKFPEVLRDLYSEIWVYGYKAMYDPISEYAFPDDIAEKTVFTGYIPRKVPRTRKVKRKHKQVVVTIGGGGDGYSVLDNYLKMLEANGTVDFKTLMITGPFLSPERLDELADRARALKEGCRSSRLCATWKNAWPRLISWFPWVGTTPCAKSCRSRSPP